MVKERKREGIVHDRCFSLPSPDWWDYTDIPVQIKGWETYPIFGGNSEPFAMYKQLRGQELAFIDLAYNPEIIQYCLDKLFSLAYTDAMRIYETIPGQEMLTGVSEDMGGQKKLMFSSAHIRKFLFPGMKRMIDLAHQAGAFVFHHNEGNCRRMLPELIAAGIDMLNPLQWRCKDKDREGLKRDFGNQIVFHGAIDNQFTLPLGTVAEVEQEVMDNLRIFGAEGGYILAPCHSIQSVTPPENIIALYSTGYQGGWIS